MEPFTLASLSLLVLKITSVAKFLSAGAWRDAITQLVAWAAGVGVIFVAANADMTESLAPAGVPLGVINGWSLVLLGMAFGSAASFGYDLKAAVDHSDTAAEPPLGGGTTGVADVADPAAV